MVSAWYQGMRLLRLDTQDLNHKMFEGKHDMISVYFPACPGKLYVIVYSVANDWQQPQY